MEDRERYPKYLPIGTVVTLEGHSKKLMITGYLAFLPNVTDAFDYNGVLYPEGLVDPRRIIVFGHSDIERVHYTGYKTKEWEELVRKLIMIKIDDKFMKKNRWKETKY